MNQRRALQIVETIALLFGLAVALAPGALVPSANAAPMGAHKLYLPLVTKPLPTLTVSDLNMHANTGTQCYKAQWDFSGPSPLDVFGQATQLNTDALVQHGLGKAYHFDWKFDGQPWFSHSGVIGSDPETISTFVYTANLDCTGQLPQATYLIELYVDNVFRHVGTIIVH